MTAFLVRHTRVAAETAGFCYGRSDVPLASSFEDEARALRALLPDAPAVVWSSPARRCAVLAERLAGAAEVRVDARLAELNFGAWEGRRWESFRGAESEAWALDPWGLRPPGGESGLEFWARVAEAREQVLRESGEGLAVIVTHAGVIRTWLALAAGEQPGPGVWAREAGHGRVWAAI
jgi:alpha-ribazole phosphatase